MSFFKIKHFIGLLCAAVIICHGQSTITGQITDVAGTGIAGVQLKLSKANLIATTDANGNYAFNGTPIQPHQAQAISAIKYNQGNLFFHVPTNGTHVSIESYTLDGIKYASIHKTMDVGAYQVTPSLPQGQMAILKVSIGAQNYTFKASRLTNTSVESITQLEPSSALAKTLIDPAITFIDTIRVSKTGYAPAHIKLTQYTGVYNFKIGQIADFWGNITSYPVATKVMTFVFLNRTNGVIPDNKITWSFNGSKFTIADHATFDMPANSAGRVNFSIDGPGGTYTDFIEHTIGASSYNGNTTRVDAFGFPIMMRLICGDGSDKIVGENYEVFYMGREKFYKIFNDEVPVEQDHLATQKFISAPRMDALFLPTGTYADYYKDYVDEVWKIHNYTKPKPIADDIFACSGKMSGDPQMCGALNRHMAHLPENQWSNVPAFYQAAPANFYSNFLHDYSYGNKTYGFAYDDAKEQASFVSCSKPKYLIIALGF